MMGLANQDRADRLRQARETVRRLEGRTTGSAIAPHLSLDQGGPIDQHLPDAGLALASLHELVLPDGRDGAGLGLAVWLLGQRVARTGGKPVLWVDTSRAGPLLPQGLRLLGLAPDRLVEVRARAAIDRLWTMEEAARSPALAAVVGVVDRLDLTASRRLQLAAEAGGGLCLLLRSAHDLGTSAAVTRWQATAAPSQPIPLSASLARSGAEEPGLGHPVWDLHLLRARGAPPAQWRVMPGDDGLLLPPPCSIPTIGTPDPGLPADRPTVPSPLTPPVSGQVLPWPGRRAA